MAKRKTKEVKEQPTEEPAAIEVPEVAPDPEPTEEEIQRQRLLEEIQQEQSLARALLTKAEQMLQYPLAKTTQVTDHEGRAVVTEIHPAKWSMADAAKLYDAAKELLHRSEQRQRDLERGAIDRIPSWVPTYLAAWGTTRPDGKMMTVQWASSLAGTSASNVRNQRQRSRQFRRMEEMARFGTQATMTEFIDAGLRGNASTIFDTFMRLIDDGDVRAVLKAMEWLRGKPIEVDVKTGPQTFLYLPDNLRGPRPEPPEEEDALNPFSLTDDHLR